MAESVLVVDFGTTSSSGALVDGGRVRPVKEPGSGSYSWPSSVYLDGADLLVGIAAERRKRTDPARYRAEFKRELGQDAPIMLGDRSLTAEELITAVLRVMAAQARELAGGAVERLLLTVPAGYRPAGPRWTSMISAGEAAGFPEVELLPEPVAAALAPTAGEAFKAGALVLVYDFGGGTFDTALVRFNEDGTEGGTEGGHEGGTEVLGHAALEDCGGRDVDALLSAHVHRTGDAELTGLLTPGGLPGLRARLALGDLVRGIKHQLTDAEHAEEFLTPFAPPYGLSRSALEELSAPLLDRTVDACRDLLSRCGVKPDELDAILLTGGASRMPAVSAALDRAFGRPLRRAEDPELAVVQGAARHAARPVDRLLDPDRPPRNEVPLRWSIPGGSGTLLRWLVQPGDVYRAGDALAVVRAADSSLWRLRAPAKSGQIKVRHALPGSTVTSADWLATAGPPARAMPLQGGLVWSPEPVVLRTLEQDGPITSMAFRPGTKTLAVASLRRTVLIWNTASGGRENHFIAESHFHSLAFSPDGSVLAGSGDDGKTFLWNMHSQIRLRKPLKNQYHYSTVRAAAFHPGGHLLATGRDDGSVLFWDTGTWRQDPQAFHVGVQPRALAFSPDGTVLAAGCSDGTVRFWSVDEQSPLDRSWEGHGQAIRSVEFSHDGTVLAASGEDGTAALWDVAARSALGDPLGVADTALLQVAFCPAAPSLLATGCADGTVHLWDAADRTRIGDPLKGRGTSITALAFSSDGTLLAAGGHDGSTQLWQVLEQPA